MFHAPTMPSVYSIAGFVLFVAVCCWFLWPLWMKMPGPGKPRYFVRWTAIFSITLLALILLLFICGVVEVDENAPY